MESPQRFTSFGVISKVKEDIFSILPGYPKKFNLITSLCAACKIDKGSAVVFWDRQDYLKEAERQLSDNSICKETNVTEKDLVDLANKSRNFFANLERINIIQEKEKNKENRIRE